MTGAATAAGAHIEYDFEHYKDSRWYAPARWLAPRLGVNQAGNVYEFSFPGTPISSWRPIVASAAELQTIQRFEACSEDLNSQDLLQLAKFKQLKELGFNYVGDVPSLESLATLPHLERLSIHGNGLTAAKLAPLRTAPKLRVLDLAHTDASDEIIALLTTFPHLEVLHLTSSDITVTSLAGLKKSKSLKILHVDSCKQGEENLLPGVKIVAEH